MTKDEALKLALEALDCIYSPLHVREIEKVGNAMKAIKEALEQPEFVLNGIDCSCGRKWRVVNNTLTASEQPEQESDDLTAAYLSGVYDGKNKYAPQPKQEPVAWRNAAIRVGENLCSVGPFGYYEMTAKQWLDWALSVVTVHAPPPQREWVGLTDEEIGEIEGVEIKYIGTGEYVIDGEYEFARAIEAKLLEKNGC